MCACVLQGIITYSHKHPSTHPHRQETKPDGQIHFFPTLHSRTPHPQPTPQTSSFVQETQTKPEGQIHFFPIIFEGKQLYDVMLERCGPTQTSAPKQQ